MRNSIAPNEYIKEDCFNSHAKAINKALEISFCDYILPHRLINKQVFIKADAKLYVSNRGRVNIQVPIQNIKHFNDGYEDILYRIFWNNEVKRKLIFITGSIGCGKSTFLDYFLRCYCPSKFNYKEEFPKKLILHIDFKGVSNNDDFRYCILDGISRSLKINKIYNHFKEVIDGFGDKDERIFRVLQNLSNCIEEKKYSYRYLTICFDNIDQSPPEIQSAAILLAQNLIEEASEIKIYKIFFPLWPKTLKRFKLRNILKISSAEYLQLDLPHPNLKLVYIKRIRNLLNIIDNDQRSSVKYFIKSINYRIDSASKKFLFDISYGNLKMMGFLLSDLLKSHAIDRYQSSYKDIRDYQFLDSLLCGCKRTHDADNSLILNPFLIISESSSPGDTIIFGYLLFYFKEQRHSYSETIDFFSKLNFQKALVSDVLEILASHCLIHFDYFEGGERHINVHHKVIKAYLRLLVDPAAIDNFAQTTPMYTKFIEDRKPTVGYEDSDFTRRVDNSISFIKFLKLEESTFFKNFSDDDLEQLRLKIPSLSDKVKYSYLERLKALNIKNKPNHHSVNLFWWDKIFNEINMI